MLDTDDDFDSMDEEEKSVAARRFFTYSPAALGVASQVQRVFVAHPAFKAALEGCDRIFQLGRELNLQQGAVIAGPTGVGKTALIRYFRETLPNSNLFEQGAGVLALRIRRRPNVGQIVGGLLKQLRYPFPVTANTLWARRDNLVEALRHKGTRLIFVDEAHHLREQTKMRSRTLDDGTSATEFLRELMDDVPLGLCLAGAEDLLNLQSIDESLGGRVSAKFELRDFEDGATWRGFLRAFHKKCTSFDVSIIESKDEADKLFRVSNGNPRTFKRLITEAVLVAADASSTAVRQEHITVAFHRTNGPLAVPGTPYAA